MLVACWGGPSAAERTARREADARLAHAEEASAAFAPHIDEYLNPAWTAVAPKAGTLPSDPPSKFGLEMILPEAELVGNRSGQLVIVSADNRDLHCGISWVVSGDPDDRLDSPQEWATPGMYAPTPEQVGTVVVVWSYSVWVGTYEDGSRAYRDDLKVRVVDLDTGQIVDDGYLLGSKPPASKLGSGEAHGDPPRCASLDAALATMTDAESPPGGTTTTAG